MHINVVLLDAQRQLCAAVRNMQINCLGIVACIACLCRFTIVKSTCWL